LTYDEAGSPKLPLAVQIGFAGSRRLAEHAVMPQAAAALRAQLKHHLAALRDALGLDDRHFLVGLSQLAAGADTLFAQTVAELGWKQRLALPQAREQFLSSQGHLGPDFSSEERDAALVLFNSKHVIEERVVSDALQRTECFEDANSYLVHQADVVVCLRRGGAASHAGGSSDFLHRAAARGIPALDLVVTWDDDGMPALVATWARKDAFVQPALPTVLDGQGGDVAVASATQPPLVGPYIDTVKALASRHAKRRSWEFVSAAVVVVSTHVLATLLAVVAMKLGSAAWGTVSFVLGLEVVLLFVGLGAHWWLHHRRSTHDWALARVCAEVARSVKALQGLTRHLEHMAAMPFPPELRPLLRTLEVLHLSAVDRNSLLPRPEKANQYIADRLLAMNGGQVPYYSHQHRRALRVSRTASKVFGVLSLLAIFATLAKLAIGNAAASGATEQTLLVAGVLAVWLPVLAVGAMSISSALDAEGREHTFRQTQAFLTRQIMRLQAAANSRREFTALVVETETRLLSETLGWYVRRTFTTVS
jgi:hypothetical protein